MDASIEEVIKEVVAIHKLADQVRFLRKFSNAQKFEALLYNGIRYKDTNLLIKNLSL